MIDQMIPLGGQGVFLLFCNSCRPHLRMLSLVLDLSPPNLGCFVLRYNKI